MKQFAHIKRPIGTGHLPHFAVQRGLGWAMSEHDFATYDQFKVLDFDAIAPALRCSSFVPKRRQFLGQGARGRGHCFFI
jgi:hypothetical protein